MVERNAHAHGEKKRRSEEKPRPVLSRPDILGLIGQDFDLGLGNNRRRGKIGGIGTSRELDSKLGDMRRL